MTLQELRHINKLTQKQVADKLGFSLCFIVKLESGERFPSSPTAQKLANLYKVTESQIFLCACRTKRSKLSEKDD